MVLIATVLCGRVSICVPSFATPQYCLKSRHCGISFLFVTLHNPQPCYDIYILVLSWQDSTIRITWLPWAHKMPCWAHKSGRQVSWRGDCHIFLDVQEYLWLYIYVSVFFYSQLDKWKALSTNCIMKCISVLTAAVYDLITSVLVNKQTFRNSEYPGVLHWL